MCDTWVALPDATSSKQVIFAKNSDRPIFDCQPLMRYPRQKWSAGDAIQLEYIEIPQVSETYSTLGSSPYWCWGYEEGINEYGVVIGNEAIYTKTFKQLAKAYLAGNVPDFGLIGMDIIRLALERSETAHQAVGVMGQLIEQYGQFGSAVPTKSHSKGGYDNSFIVADSSEAWVVETIGNRWIAKRFTSQFTSISNQPTIRNEWNAGSDDIESYAHQQGWWDANNEFDFARAYIDDETSRQVSHIRQMRSRQLLSEQAGNITPDWMMRIARDHYEDTFLGSPYFDAADPDFLSICMHVSPADFTWGNTASSCVAVLPEVGIPVFWWLAGPPCNGCYVPFFPQGNQLPEVLSTAGTSGKRIVPPSEAKQDKYQEESYWWLFWKLMEQTKGDAIYSQPGLYPQRNQIVRNCFDSLELKFKETLPDVVAQSHQNSELNIQALDAFTADCVNRVVQATQNLLEQFQ